MSTWNKKNFSIYTSDERSALGLIEELGKQTNYNTEELEKVKESDNKKVSHYEMNSIYKIDKNADFTGTWFGIKKPTASQEGLQATVDKIVEEDIPSINEQLDTKTNRVETQRLQNQVNNLVLGAVGDGNNAEVVSSRGDFELLGNRLDDFDARTDSLINIRNVFTDKCIKSKSWNIINGDYNIDYGSSFSNAIIAQNGNTNISLFKDINVSKLTSGDYVFNLKCLNNDKDFNLFISINVIGYPTSVSSGGTTLYSYSDLRIYDITLKKGYQKNELKFKLNTSGYDHCRFIIELRTKNQTYNITDIYLGLENTECNDFSYIDSKLSNIVNEIGSVKNNINKLKGKTLYLDGDSITFGAGYNGGYGKILSDKYSCINTNNAVSGGTLASGTTYGNGSARHYIAESVVNSVNSQYDFMILSGGFNDYGNNVPIGTLSDAEFCFTIPVKTDNVIGALETMFRHVLQNYPTTKVYFLITHKANRCTTQVNSIGKTMQDYVNAIKSVCERYSIPIINVWEESKMLTVYDNIANTYTNGSDRVHPNQLGYEEFYLPVIEKELGL